MKSDKFTANGISIERRETREGPSPYFVIYYKNTSCITTDVSSIKRLVKIARGTETLQTLNAWLESFQKKVEAIPAKTKHAADAA